MGDVGVADASGYVMLGSNGQPVGALELTGGTTRRAILPNNDPTKPDALSEASKAFEESTRYDH